jgi:hypothetical protein
MSYIRRNVVAYLALFVALGGTSYAATQLPAGSVGTRQLRNGAVTNSKVRRGSLSAAVLSPAAVSALKGKVKPRVVVKQAPPAGPCGSTCSLPPGTSQTATADCPSRMHAVGGGYAIAPEDVSDSDVTVDEPTSNDTGWRIAFTWTQTAGSDFPGGTIYAICVP